MSDPDFVGGRYVEHGVFPWRGQKVARMMAHITYVSDHSLQDKFGRRRRSTGDAWEMGPDFEVEHYLQHQGMTFLDRFDALSYLYLTRLLDYFDPFGDPGTADALRSSATRFQVTSFDTDWRFDTAQSRRMVDQLDALGVDVDFAELHLDVRPADRGHRPRSCSPARGFHGASVSRARRGLRHLRDRRSTSTSPRRTPCSRRCWSRSASSCCTVGRERGRGGRGPRGGRGRAALVDWHVEFALRDIAR